MVSTNLLVGFLGLSVFIDHLYIKIRCLEPSSLVCASFRSFAGRKRGTALSEGQASDSNFCLRKLGSSQKKDTDPIGFVGFVWVFIFLKKTGLLGVSIEHTVFCGCCFSVRTTSSVCGNVKHVLRHFETSALDRCCRKLTKTS